MELPTEQLMVQKAKVPLSPFSNARMCYKADECCRDNCKWIYQLNLPATDVCS